MFVTHGLPVSVKTDNGPQFRSREFQKFAEGECVDQRHICCGLILLLVENFCKPAHFFLTSLFFSNQEYNFEPAYLSTV